MSYRPDPGHPPYRRAERGFTMVELVLTFTLIAILTAMMIPKIGRTMQATRVNRTSAIVAADLEQAFTLAGRFRRPMRIVCDCANATYTIADRADATAIRLRRTLVGDSDLGNMTVVFETLPVAGVTLDIFPSGISTTRLRVRITSGISTRAVTLSTAGHVRIIP